VADTFGTRQERAMFAIALVAAAIALVLAVGWSASSLVL
jgi:hypothetical protein